MNFINNNLGNNYIESNEISISKELKDELINKFYYISNKEGANPRKGYLFIDQKQDSNKDKDKNNKNEKKDIDIKINNINYQQNQISNSNIYFNVSYSKDNTVLSEKESEKKLNEKIEIKPKQNDLIPDRKENRRIQINEDKNIIIHYLINSSLEDNCQIFNNKNEETPEYIKSFMNLDEYVKNLKEKKSIKPCIKKFDIKTFNMDKNYVLAEDLSEDKIVPDLFEDDDEDIQSLRQSLERSIDKMFVHSFNDKINEPSINDSNFSENIDNNSNNKGKIIMNQLKDMFMENINEVNEEEKGEEEYTYEEIDENNDEKNDNK